MTTSKPQTLKELVDELVQTYRDAIAAYDASPDDYNRKEARLVKALKTSLIEYDRAVEARDQGGSRGGV